VSKKFPHAKGPRLRKPFLPVAPVGSATGSPWNIDPGSLPELADANPIHAAEPRAIRKAVAKDLARVPTTHPNVQDSPTLQAYLTHVRELLYSERNAAFWIPERRGLFQWKAVWAWVEGLARDRGETVLEAILALKAAFEPGTPADTDLRPLESAYWTVSAGLVTDMAKSSMISST
jgi:hypothetical protein